MPDIDIIRYHSLPLAAAKSRVQKTADELSAEHHLKSAWLGDTLSFERSGLHGEIRVTHSEIHLQATLGFLMKPFKGQLVDRIEEKLERVFPAAEAESQARKPPGKTTRTARRVESEKKARPAGLTQRR